MLPDSYEVSGNLTLLGKTQPITVKALQTGNGKDPWGNFRQGFETSFTIERSDFGMDFMMGVAGDDVLLTVSVEGMRQRRGSRTFYGPVSQLYPGSFRIDEHIFGADQFDDITIVALRRK